MNKRTKVYEAIDSEREYQIYQTKNSERPDMIADFHLGDALSAIRYNLSKAEEEWYKGAAPHAASMKYLRKVAGLCVMMGEIHGMPERE
jgi:hypothetical protein